MTDRELYARMLEERRALPDGFEERNELLLRCLTRQERKVNMKKIVLIALAATLLLGSIAYAASQVDLPALIFRHEAATTQQIDYVNSGTQYAAITRVATGGQKRGDYASGDLTLLPLESAYIGDVAAFVDGARLVIGFVKTEAGQPWELSCDGFFVNDVPVAGGLEESNGVFSLDAELPTALLGKELTVTLPLHLYRDGQAQGYQYVSFALSTSSVVYTPVVMAVISDQLRLTLMTGTLSPMGLRIPLRIDRGERVSDTVSCSCFMDGKEVMGAWQGGTDEADDVLVLPVTDIPQSLEIRAAWQETQDGSVYDCGGTVRFLLSEGTADVSDVTRAFAYQQPDQPAPPALSTGIALYDLDAAPRAYILRPRVMDMTQLTALAKGVIPRDVIESSACVDESATSRSYRPDSGSHDITACVYYDPATGQLTIMGPGAVDENWLGAVDAPNCSLTMEDAKTAAMTFMERFGYTAEMLRVEHTEAFVADGQGGYFVYLNVLDEHLPRFISRGGYPATPWRLMIKDRGVCQVEGRLVTVENVTETSDAISLEEAREKAMRAVAAGEYWAIDRESTLAAIRAVGYAKDPYTWKNETSCAPAWEFDFTQDGSWMGQLCVDRQTGEIFDPNERPAVKLEGR